MTMHSHIAQRVSRMLPRLASDHDGEVIATVAAIRRTLAGAGADLHDLANAIETSLCKPDEAAVQAWATLSLGARLHWLDRMRQTQLTHWERVFILDVRAKLIEHPGSRFSPKQTQILEQLYRQVVEAAGGRRP